MVVAPVAILSGCGTRVEAGLTNAPSGQRNSAERLRRNAWHAGPHTRRCPRALAAGVNRFRHTPRRWGIDVVPLDRYVSAGALAPIAPPVGSRRGRR